MDKYRQGSVIPRALVRSSDRKAQHNIKFGADVEVDGRSINAISNGTVICIGKMVRRMNNGTYKKCHVSMTGLQIVGSNQSSIGIRMSDHG